MKRIRHLLPTASLTLCIAFLAFTAMEIMLSKSPGAKPQKSIAYDLVYQTGHMDSSGVFTRQSGDSEIDDTDPDGRIGNRDLNFVGAAIQSLTLSVKARAAQHQLPSVSVATGSRTLLYRRLII